MPTPSDTNLAPSTRSGIGYRGTLDGLRALAIVAVLLYHGGVVWANRFTRGRGLLRPVWIPDHLTADRGVARKRDDRTACLLGETRAAAPSSAVLHGGGRGTPRGARVRRQLAARPPGRRNRGPVLLRQLARDRDPVQLLRADRRGVTAPAHLVARDRGAVLRPSGPFRCWPGSGSRVAAWASVSRPTGACWERCWQRA